MMYNSLTLDLTDACRIFNLINKKIILRLINELLRPEGWSKQQIINSLPHSSEVHQCLEVYSVCFGLARGHREHRGATMV